MFGKKSTAGELIAVTGKQAEKAAKEAAKAANKTEKAAKKAQKVIPSDRPPNIVETLTNPRTARRALRVVQITGPALAPFALEAATTVRAFLDDRRAMKLGVTADEVAAYRGPTGATSARIATLRSSIAELRARRSGDLQVSRFADVARSRLADLSTAVNTSASMPSARRRSTLAAVSRELNQIEADLMTFLVSNPR
jgi:hypothetical protein